LASHRTETVEGDELAGLLFGQQHPGSRDFFTASLGQYHTVPLSAFPHLAFARDPEKGRAVFEDYLERSWSFVWPENNTPEARYRHLERFLERRALVEQGERSERPILVVRRRDGRYVIVDGNHRAAIALALGRPATLNVLSGRRWLSEVATTSGAFFGSDYLGMPYQSLFDREREVVEGRRKDTLERVGKVLPEDLVGQRVLDLGSNIGAIAFAAADLGAKSVLGLEADPRMVTSAIRLNSYFASDVDFCVHDLTEPYRLSGEVDTILCFSVAHHVKRLDGLERTIRESGSKVVYFEGHSGATIHDYPTLLSRDIFKEIDLLGRDGRAHSGSGGDRPLFRCATQL
jgi:hypothetical protein